MKTFEIYINITIVFNKKGLETNVTLVVYLNFLFSAKRFLSKNKIKQ